MLAFSLLLCLNAGQFNPWIIEMSDSRQIKPVPDSSMQLVLTCAGGLESALVRELTDLKLEDRIRTKKSGVICLEADLATAYQCVMWSRVANRVLLPLVEKPLVDEEDFYQAMKAWPWEQHCDEKASFAITWAALKSDHHGQAFMA